MRNRVKIYDNARSRVWTTCQLSMRRSGVICSQIKFYEFLWSRPNAKTSAHWL